MLNTNAVRFEYVLPDRTKADYVLCDRFGRVLGVIKSTKAAINPAEAEAQAKAYAALLKLQRQFVRRVETLNSALALKSAALRTVERTFSSLLSRSFNSNPVIAESGSEEAAVA